MERHRGGAPSKAGTNVRVVLAPSRSRAWCAGTFHGTVWDAITLNCGSACPASLPPSGWIGKLTFRVTPGWIASFAAVWRSE